MPRDLDKKLDAYICAKTGRGFGAEEALAVVREASEQGYAGQRGLAIWSIGQLGMWDVLEAIAEHAAELEQCEFEAQRRALVTANLSE